MKGMKGRSGDEGRLIRNPDMFYAFKAIGEYYSLETVNMVVRA